MHRTWLSRLDRHARELVARVRATPLLHALLTGRVDADGMRLYLLRTAQYVRLTPPLLEAAARRLAARPGYEGWVDLFAEKARQEQGHDAWAEEGLAALGCPEGYAAAQPVPRPIQAYERRHRKAIAEGEPLSYLGTAYVLEQLAVSCAGEAVRAMEQKAPFAEALRTLTFLRGHMDADPGHVDELRERLGPIENPDVRRAILGSARSTASLYPRFFEEGARR